MITIKIRIQKLRATLENSKVPMLPLPWASLYRKKKVSTQSVASRALRKFNNKSKENNVAVSNRTDNSLSNHFLFHMYASKVPRIVWKRNVYHLKNRTVYFKKYNWLHQKNNFLMLFLELFIA